MVALSLIEAGMTPEDAVIFIREKRKGAINSRYAARSACCDQLIRALSQLAFLNKYKRRSASGKGKDCVCM